jgi:biotin transporter BioY
MMVACAIFFHRAAEFENESSLVWAGLSLVISVMTLFVLGWGWLGCLLGQAGLLLGITIFRMLRSKS